MKEYRDGYVFIIFLLCLAIIGFLCGPGPQPQYALADEPCIQYTNDPYNERPLAVPHGDGSWDEYVPNYPPDGTSFCPRVTE